MAKQRLVSNTRIYRDCRMLLDEVLDISVNFPRAHKFTIGSKMQEYAVEILNELAGAYINKSLAVRIDHLTRFQMKFETIKSLIRVSGERKWIGLKKYAQLSELLIGIGKQSSAWKSSLIAAGEKPESGGQG